MKQELEILEGRYKRELQINNRKKEDEESDDESDDWQPLDVIAGF